MNWNRVSEAGDATSVGLVVIVAALALLYGGVTLGLPGWLLVFFNVGVTFLLYGLLVLGLNLQFGYTGIVNFGHVVFFAIGGYAAAMLTANSPFAGTGLGFGWPVGLLAAVVAPTVLGLVIGISTLKLRDDFLAIATLAVAEVVHDLFTSFRSVFGGNVGITSVPQPIKAVAVTDDTALVLTVVLFAGVVLMTYGVLSRLSSSAYGRVLWAIRDDDLLANSVGKNVFRYKLQVFIYGAAIAGLAGGLFAYYNGAVAPGFFVLNVTVLVWIGMLIGGPGNYRGVLAGVGIILALRLLTRFLNQATPLSSSRFAALRLMFIGFVLILVVRYKPAGIWGDADKLNFQS